MSDTIEVKVPDIGDFADVPVIEVLVKVGDRVRKNDSLVTLESDKASMEVPSSDDGTVESIAVNVGDKVSQGATVVTLARDGADAKATEAPQQSVELRVPDIGDFHDIPVIDVLVKPGDVVTRDASLVTLESDKASMDVPATSAGTVQNVAVKVGDRVSKGSLIATLSTSSPSSSPPSPSPKAESPPAKAKAEAQPAQPATPQRAATSNGIVHASPAIRRFARELGVDLAGVTGNGPHGRITREDVQAFVKGALSGSRSTTAGVAGMPSLPPWPSLDFSKFGEVERRPQSRIKKLSGPNLHRNWLQIPHITNYDEADVTTLEAFRNEVNAEASKRDGVKLTMLAFLIKASVAALQQFPDFNSSLDGDALIYKRYYNIGFAADTPNGLVVPVVKNANEKGLIAIAAESAELARKARDGKLGAGDMQGGTFTISSIGGIGGTQFTQIVNAPEVAILGSTRAAIKPVWSGNAFEPRLILPISVSYDHRVIDGAQAARFLVYLAGILNDFRRVCL